MSDIVLVQASHVLTDAEVIAAIPALTKYVKLVTDTYALESAAFSFMHLTDFLAGKAGDVWPLFLNRHSTDPGTLGFHDTTPDGRPFGRSFSGDDILDGLSPWVTLSHEAGEMILNPFVKNFVTLRNGSIVPKELCFPGETLIPLLDGTEVPIRDLIAREEFWVYSITSEGHVVPGRGHSARLTKRDADLVRVSLDDGSYFRCTPDHQIMLRNGTYCHADHLRPGESLMPLYRRRAAIEESTKEYEQVLHQDLGEWQFTHRMVQPRCPKGWVRHHVDFNRFNNLPSNIELMKWIDHRALHAAHIVEAAKPWIARTLADGTHPFLQPHSFAHRQESSERMIAYNRSEAHRAIAGIAGAITLRRLWEDADYRTQKSDHGRRVMLAYNGSDEQAAAHLVWRTSEEGKIRNTFGAKKANHNRWHAARGITKDDCDFCQSPLNHKIASVTPNGFADVYDFTVDDYHNFALSAGVFVHNCDAVEDDSQAIVIDGLPFSNFVLPPYWSFTVGNVPSKFDYQGRLTGPCPALTPGGYQAILRPGQPWGQITEMRLGGRPSTRSLRHHSSHRRIAMTTTTLIGANP